MMTLFLTLFIDFSSVKSKMLTTSSQTRTKEKPMTNMEKKDSKVEEEVEEIWETSSTCSWVVEEEEDLNRSKR
jgi:hypothetical protein